MTRASDIAESKILAAAQMAIDGMKATTGSGPPHDDRWDGTASQVYKTLNASHRRVTSEVQVGNQGVAGILDIEAGQVSRTRQALDPPETEVDARSSANTPAPPLAIGHHGNRRRPDHGGRWLRYLVALSRWRTVVGAVQVDPTPRIFAPRLA